MYICMCSLAFGLPFSEPLLQRNFIRSKKKNISLLVKGGKKHTNRLCLHKGGFMMPVLESPEGIEGRFFFIWIYLKSLWDKGEKEKKVQFISAGPRGVGMFVWYYCTLRGSAYGRKFWQGKEEKKDGNSRNDSLIDMNWYCRVKVCTVYIYNTTST